MIHLLYGEDEFTLHETLSSMKEEVGPAELRDVNTTELKGSEVTFEELAATCNTVPFLAEKRMVIVRGLLSRFEVRAPSRTGARGTPSRDEPLGPWESLSEYLAKVPETTDLVFVEGRLRESNRLFAKMRSMAKISPFPLPARGELRRWIRQRATKRGVSIEPRAVDAMAETIGSDLRVIDQELQKLSLYRWEQTVRHQDVIEMVSYVRESNIFAAVDAVLEGRTGTAIKSIHQLLDSGNSPSYVISMIARQVRLLLLAKELVSLGVPPAQIGSRLSISGYPLRKTLEQERKFTIDQLAEIHHRLLEVDLNIKTGKGDEQLVLDMFIADLTP